MTEFTVENPSSRGTDHCLWVGHLINDENTGCIRCGQAWRAPTEYACGSNYCDDPACTQDHAELL